MIVPLMIWSLSSKLEKLEPPHTRKFPRVNAQNSKLGPIQPWDVKDFLRQNPNPSARRGTLSKITDGTSAIVARSIERPRV